MKSIGVVNFSSKPGSVELQEIERAIAGDDDVNPWGTNLTVDPAFLGAGSTVHLDGMSDSDSWERNARIVWHVSSVQIYAE